MRDRRAGPKNFRRAGDFYRRLEKIIIYLCIFGFIFGILMYRKTISDSLAAVSASNYANSENADFIPNLVFPPDNYIGSSASTADLFFSWKNPLSHPVVFQIASRSDFSGGIIIEEKLSGAAVKGRFLLPGIYYWRVISALSSRTHSNPMRFTVLSGFGAPEIITPNDEENVLVSEGLPIEFRWEKLNYADTYNFTLYSAGNELPLYEVSHLRDTAIEAYFNPDTVGTFRWIVQGNVESFNEVTRKKSLIKEHFFSIGPPGAAPVAGFVRGVIKTGDIHSPIMLVNPRPGVSFVYSHSSPPEVSWTANEELINSRVIFSHDTDPSADPRAIVQSVDNGSYSISLPALNDGVWYWVVQGDTPSGQGLSASVPSWFTVLPQPPLGAPSYIQPGQGTVMTLERLTTERSITFRWTPVPEANAYIFTLFDAAKMKMIYSSYPASATYFILQDLGILSSEEFTWQVEAVSVARNGTIERRGIVQQSAFMIDIPQSEKLNIIEQGINYGH